MSRFFAVLMIAAFLLMADLTAVRGAPEHPETLSQQAPQKNKEPQKLQAKAFNGTPLMAGPGEEFELMDTVPCGTFLLADGKQEGPWFHVKFGEVKGWVSGWLTTFDVDPNYCLGPIPAELPSVVAPAVVTDDTGASPVDAPVTLEAPAPVSTGGGYADTVAAAAATYGVSFDYLWSVVGCETGYTYDPYYGYGAAGEWGPFQFLPDTFYWLASISGIGGEWQDPYSQAYVAAWAFANGYASHWTCA